MKTYLCIVGAGLMLSSCVSSKVYKDLESRYDELKEERALLADENQMLERENNTLKNEKIGLSKSLEEMRAERDRLRLEYEGARKRLAQLESSYDALEKQSSSALAENAQRNRSLLADLEEQERILDQKRSELEKLRQTMERQSGRVAELEGILAAKEAAMKNLKDAISKALLDFEGKGLTVEQRDGKVYVSMENKLLFNSGSWQINSEGRRAVNQLGGVLASNPDISVLIEGHTDNVPYAGNGSLEDNWDLSVKRATTIVKILSENSQIDPANLTAAGKSKYVPVADNGSATGKAKNRRIEVVLTPKLDEVSKLLSEI
ncbi:cell envelope biogenesis protein OmpA [Robertkochia marina]|uniref:Cell envelope biogenesis protein OmpA n=1 Tax=Robertkochia marina TaxID=1227945 RepID=A0A4S3M420_9FLAO|nr:OmpA family protein [Robertkochia marina]THD69525.1 cell envelope biogenesis protein OmpA [Robertkochia marina]TRZ47216.1 cell envelope biogenesis protein OmpA [Robertkochia marina]